MGQALVCPPDVLTADSCRQAKVWRQVDKPSLSYIECERLSN